jgi:hypothetical protein
MSVPMVKHVLLAACLFGAAGAGQAAEFALVPMRVGECPFTLAFPGPPRVSAEKTRLLPASVDRALDLAFEYPGKAAFTASCGCSGTQTFGDITATEAREALEDSVGKADTKLLDARFTDDPALGKMIAWEGEAPSAFGKIKVWGRRYYDGQCTLQVTAGGPIDKVDPEQVARFLDSATRLAAPPPAAAPTVAAAPPPPAPQARPDKLPAAPPDVESPRPEPAPRQPKGDAPSASPGDVPETLKQAGATLAARFAETVKAASAAKRALRPADFASSEDMITLILTADKDNGHALYYAGEIARKTGAPDRGHAQFQAYLAAEASLGAAARAGGIGIAACRTARGYCRQRTAWIDRLLATDLYQDTLAKKHAAEAAAGGAKKKPAAAEAFAGDFRQALGYACNTLKLYGSDVHDPQQLAPTTKLVAAIKAELGAKGCP